MSPAPADDGAAPGVSGDIHIPVLLREIVEALAPKDGATIIDGTFGAGGYSRALLDAARCRIFGIDRDPEAVERCRALAQQYDGRLIAIAGRFGDMEAHLGDHGIQVVDGVTFDLGVSSPQIDDSARGFSFRREGPLDMRMERDGSSAADCVNTLEEAELADIIWQLGDERYARRIAKAIVAERRMQPFTTTTQLADVVRRVVPRSKDGIDPATRTFQALRIYVNDELGEVGRGLAAAERMLSPGGRLAVVSFHSLEDRIVKDFLRDRSGSAARPSRHLPAATTPQSPSFRLIGRRPATPENDELTANPRARSARLRVAERTAAPAWGEAA